MRPYHISPFRILIKGTRVGPEQASCDRSAGCCKLGLFLSVPNRVIEFAVYPIVPNKLNNWNKSTYCFKARFLLCFGLALAV